MINRKNITTFLKIVVPLSFGFFLVFLFYKKLTPQNKTDIVDALKRANYIWLLLSVGCTFLSQIVRSIRWKNLVNSNGYNISTLKAFNAVSVNYLVNLGIPRAGELARCGVLATYDKIPVEKSLGTLVNERIVDVLMLGFIGLLTLIFQHEMFIQFYELYVHENFLSLFQFLLSNIMLLFVAIVLILGMFYGIYYLNKSGKLPLAKKLKDLSIGLWEGIVSVKNLKNPGLFLAQSFIIWILYGLMIYFGFQCLEEGRMLVPMATLAVLFFGTFGFIAVPGGIGAYPAIMGVILTFYGLEEVFGNTIGWVVWAGQTTLILVLGLVAFTMLSREKNLLIIKESDVSK